MIVTKQAARTVGEPWERGLVFELTFQPFKLSGNQAFKRMSFQIYLPRPRKRVRVPHSNKGPQSKTWLLGVSKYWAGASFGSFH